MHKNELSGTCECNNFWKCSAESGKKRLVWQLSYISKPLLIIYNGIHIFEKELDPFCSDILIFIRVPSQDMCLRISFKDLHVYLFRWQYNEISSYD